MNAVNPIPSPAAGAEPSMEEILASIRRIIADDQPLPGSVPHEPAATAPAREAPQAEAVPVPSAESKLDPMPPEHGAVAAPQFPTPEGTSGMTETPHPLKPDAEPELPEPVPAAVSSVENAFEISAPEPEVHEDALRELHDEPSVREAVLGTDKLVEAQIFEAHIHDEQVRELLEHKVQDTAAEEPRMRVHDSLREPSAPSEGPAAAGLFSTATSQSLAAAFNTLAISRLADNSEELRGMARDMLRPLLKDWLDANLPGLVESIIREEIEQMARRGR